MRKYLTILFAVTIIVFSSCTNGQTQTSTTSLSAIGFEERIKELPLSPVIDVRTPEEFSKGHLQNAQNYDWNSSDFQRQVSTLDKSKPVFVYCLSGGRSTSAAKQMRVDGFKKVYELSGGMMKWRAANLPETTSNTLASTGMTKQQFDALLHSDKLVLIDFYADWCVPCKKMKPYLDEIARDMADDVVVVRINADDHQQLCKELEIDALPVLQLYKNNTMSWSNTGFISKEEVVKKLQ